LWESRKGRDPSKKTERQRPAARNNKREALIYGSARWGTELFLRIETEKNKCFERLSAVLQPNPKELLLAAELQQKVMKSNLGQEKESGLAPRQCHEKICRTRPLSQRKSERKRQEKNNRYHLINQKK